MKSSTKNQNNNNLKNSVENMDNSCENLEDKVAFNTSKNNNDRDEIKKRLQDIKNSIRKEFGKEAIFSLEDNDEENDVLSTGSIKIDSILGNGGLKKGTIVEIYGPESSGKTTLSLNIIKSIQEIGGIAAFIDVEHAMDLTYAEKIGVHTKEMLLSQPNSGEESLELLSRYIDQKVDVVVVDSVAALVPKAEIDGEIGDAHIGLQARLMTHALKKITSRASKNNTIIIFINQVRFKIGVNFGNPETTPGGNALKFACCYRLEVRKKESIKNGDEIIGNRVAVKCLKNKRARPFMNTEITINYNEGISVIDELISLSVEYNIIQKSGSWYSIGDRKLGQGTETVIKTLKQDDTLLQNIKNDLLKKMGWKIPLEKNNRDLNIIKEKLNTIKDEIRKEFGKESVFTIDDVNGEYMEKISIGSLKINQVIGGGLVKGRIIEIYGQESSGKTTLSLHAIKSIQESGGIAAFIDVEHSMDLDYAEKIGVKIDELLLCQPNSGEEALALLNRYIEAKVNLIVLDSVAALVTKAELDGTMSDAHVGSQARLMGQALRKITGKASKNDTIVIFINQLRSKIGGYGNPDTTPGGNALKFSCSMRLDVKKREAIKGGVNGEEIIGNKVSIKCVKNKVAPPFKEALITINYNEGINIFEEILQYGVEYGLIEKSGTWYSLNGEKIAQGADKAIEYLKSHHEITNELQLKIKNHLNLNNTKNK